MLVDDVAIGDILRQECGIEGLRRGAEGRQQTIPCAVEGGYRRVVGWKIQVELNSCLEVLLRATDSQVVRPNEGSGSGRTLE
jgi:hypothetical protein